MRTNRKNKLKIIAACFVAIFSLAAVFGGAFAWFTLAVNQTADTEPFTVINLGSCDFYSIELIKFDYKSSTYGTGSGAFTVTDYLTPETGKVNIYTYDKTRKQFGYTEDETWYPVEVMNMYDPVNLLIYGTGLISLNCNAIYKFTVSSQDLVDVTMSSTLHKLINRVKQDNEIFLSDCADFDFFFNSDLSDSNPAFIIEDDPSTPEDESDTKPYYPSYISKSKSLTALEDVYYKLSYLSSLKNSHVNLYESGEGTVPLLDNTDVSFVHDVEADTGLLSFYVNVNYAPDQLEQYKTHIYSRNIHAIFDYGFRFYFFRRGAND